MITFQNIAKSFSGKEVLRDVSFDVRRGEIFFIVGASGVGKSVLIKHLVGLLKPDAGRIFLDQVDITDYDEQAMYAVRKRCAIVFQHSTLFDSMTCAENVTIGWTDCGHGDDWRSGVVLDPFAGSGTTLMVATGHGRDAIGCDIDERNAELALERVGPLLLTVEHLADGDDRATS